MNQSKSRSTNSESSLGLLDAGVPSSSDDSDSSNMVLLLDVAEGAWLVVTVAGVEVGVVGLLTLLLAPPLC